MNIKNIISELKRRNVFKVATAYAIAGWLIIQITDTVFPRFGLPEWTIIFVMSLVFIGLPISLIIAWAFELTPEGLKKTNEVEAEKSITPDTGKKLNRIIITVLSVTLVFVLIERVYFAQAGTIEEADSLPAQSATIAVLPFVNMSDDQNNEYFSDGLSEELLNGLAKLEDIQVAGRTSSFQFKGQNPDLRDVGSLLGVKHILEGSVRKSGNRIRITAQLIQADNGFHLWSETYDRELTASDVFDIQEEITLKVVEELKIRLLPEEETELDNLPTQDIEAYNAYLEATQLEVDRVVEDIKKAIEKYEEAIRIDPSFALAYSRLAYAYLLLYSYGDVPLEEAKFEVRKNVDQALMLDKNQGKAYQAQALYHLDFESDYEKAEESAMKAIELSPSDPFSYNVLSNIYTTQRRWDDSREPAKKAYELDPLNPVIASNYADDLQSLENYEEALEILEKVLKRNPDYSAALTNKVNILSSGPYGEIDEAFKVLFNYYQKDRSDINSIYELYILSRTLKIIPLMQFFQSEMEAYYPNNTALLNMKGWTLIEQGEYGKAEDEFNEYIDEYGESFKEYAIGYMNGIYYNQGKYQEWIDLVEQFNPEFLDEEPLVADNQLIMLLNYSSFLELVGQTERATHLQKIAIDAIEQNIKEFEEEGRSRPIMFQSGQIYIHTKNRAELIELAETMYFEKNEKAAVSNFIFEYHFARDLIAGDPKFEELKKRINEDMGLMRAEVIEYLKEEGEWREAWGGGNSK